MRVDGRGAYGVLNGTESTVFPFTVPLIALRKAIEDFDKDVVKYVLSNIKETVKVGT
jgi:hypothetical protein